MKIKWWHTVVFFVIIALVAVLVHPSKFRVGLMLKHSARLEQAVEKFKDIYHKHPDNYRAAKQLANTLEDLGSTEEAATLYEKSLQLKQSDAYFDDVARFYEWTHNRPKEVEIYEKWFKWRDDHNKGFSDDYGKKVLENLYAHYLLDKNYDGAIKILDMKREIDPQKADVYEQEMAYLYEQKGDRENAVKLFEMSLKRKPWNRELLFKLLNLIPTGSSSEFVKERLLANVKKAPEDDKNWQYLIYYATRVGDIEAGDKAYDEWMGYKPNDIALKKEYFNWLIGVDKQKKAIGLLEKYLSDNPENKDPYFFTTLVKLYEWNNMYDKLYTVYMGNFQRDPSNRVNTKKLVDLAFYFKKTADLHLILNKLLAIAPYDNEYVKYKLDLFYTENNSAGAIELLENVVKKNPNPMFKKTLAELYVWNGQPRKARKLLAEMIDAGSQDPDVFRYAGDAYSASGDNKTALKYYEIYTEKMPNDYYGHFRVGELTKASKDKAVQARSKDELNRALEILQGKKDPASRLAEGRAYALLGQNEKAIEIFEGILAKERTIDAYLPYLDTLIEKKDFVKANEIMDSAKNKYANNKDLRRTEARLYSNEKKYKAAQNILTDLSNQEPDNAGIKTDLAYSYLDEGEWMHARSIFNELLTGDPDNQDISAALDDIWYNYQKRIYTGFRFTDIGGGTRYEPNIGYKQYLTSKWWLHFDYMFGRDHTTIAGVNPNFNVYTHEVKAGAFYQINKQLYAGGYFWNSISDDPVKESYHPGLEAMIEFNDPTYGRALLTGYYNKLLKDPIAALYYNGTRDSIQLWYDNKFYNDRFYLDAVYQSNWYRVDGALITPGGGDTIGREDVAGIGIWGAIFKKPLVKLGYGFLYSKLHIQNNYLNVVPLIPEQMRSTINLNFMYDWTKWWQTEAGAFTGYDPKRHLNFNQLYGFSLSNRWIVSKNVEILQEYEYSSESLIGQQTGRYQTVYLGFAFRF